MAEKKPDAATRVIGGLTITGPARVDGMWLVVAVDTITEERASKRFDSHAKAERFIEQLTGVPYEDPLANPTPTAAAAAKQVSATSATPPQIGTEHTRISRTTGETLTPESIAAAPFNLGAVREVLERYKLDPFAEVAEVLMRHEPLRARDGTPLLDEKTGEPLTRPVIDGVERAKLLVELGQYIAPKLKAVEMKVEDKTKLTEEQLDQRINRVVGDLVRAAASGAGK